MEYQNVMQLNGVMFYTDKYCKACGGTGIEIGEIEAGPNGVSMTPPKCLKCGAEKPIMQRKIVPNAQGNKPPTSGD